MNQDHRNWLFAKREGDGLPWKTEPEARVDAAPQGEPRRRERGGRSRRRWV